MSNIGSSKESSRQLPDRDELKATASEVAQKATQHGKEKLEVGKNKAADQAQDMAGVVEQVSAGLADRNQESLAAYATQIADQIKGVADHLRGRSIEELVTDAQSVARRNPGLFLVGSVAVGFAISRFFKATAKRDAGNESDRAGQRFASVE